MSKLRKRGGNQVGTASWSCLLVTNSLVIDNSQQSPRTSHNAPRRALIDIFEQLKKPTPLYCSQLGTSPHLHPHTRRDHVCLQQGWSCGSGVSDCLYTPDSVLTVSPVESISQKRPWKDLCLKPVSSYVMQGTPYSARGQGFDLIIWQPHICPSLHCNNCFIH